MPKQIHNIQQFHGGLSSNSDPRDIDDSELSSATDVMVDEIGKIRMMGGTATHDAPANVAAINAGYGLFQFSHDRKLDSLLITATGSHGRSVGDWVGNASDFTAGGTSVGILYEVPSATTFIISKHKTGSNVWSVNDDIFYSNDAPQIMADTSAADTSVNVHGSTVPSISTPETGEDYLAMADTDGAADIDIYDVTGDVWRTSLIDLGSTTGMKPTFYNVDGALRVSDGNFNNTNQWYGYIDRKYFGGDADEVYDAWKAENQLLSAPTDGYIRKHNGAAIWGTSPDKPLDSGSSTGDGFLRMSMSGSGTSTITTWMELTDYDDGELNGYWYTKYGSWDTVNYSESLDSSMEEGHTGADYFATTFTDANRDSGSDDADIVVSLSNPSAPSGYDAAVTKMMSLAKHKAEHIQDLLLN